MTAVGNLNDCHIEHFEAKLGTFQMALEGESSGLVACRGLNIIRNVKKIDIWGVWRWASAGSFFGRAKSSF